jgi:hypothetical protein
MLKEKFLPAATEECIIPRFAFLCCRLAFSAEYHACNKPGTNRISTTTKSVLRAKWSHIHSKHHAREGLLLKKIIMFGVKLRLWLCYASIEVKKKLMAIWILFIFSPEMLIWTLNFSQFYRYGIEWNNHL